MGKEGTQHLLDPGHRYLMKSLQWLSKAGLLTPFKDEKN